MSDLYAARDGDGTDALALYFNGVPGQDDDGAFDPGHLDFVELDALLLPDIKPGECWRVKLVLEPLPDDR